MTGPGSFFTHLQCSSCGEAAPRDGAATVCGACAKPLLARYDLAAARAAGFSPEKVRARGRSLWRYREVLPVLADENVVTLGEGATPLVDLPGLAARLGLARVLVKDESMQPTLSFKARGLALAVSKAKEAGVREIALPSAGNAAGAAAAYGARAGLRVHVAMPEDAPKANVAECRAAGADVHLVKGLISDAAKWVRAGVEREGWFDVSTLREPYRIEGKKTLGYEIADDLDYDLPDAIVYPTGGGTGLIGMWKAFAEMEALRWIGPRRPRMVAVQAAGCPPIVRAFEEGAAESRFFEGAATAAAGLRVPKALGDFLVLRAVRESGGAAVAVTDGELSEDARVIGSETGLLLCPEGAATVSALKKLAASGGIRANERVVLFNTAAWAKY